LYNFLQLFIFFSQKFNSNFTVRGIGGIGTIFFQSFVAGILKRYNNYSSQEGLSVETTILLKFKRKERSL